MTDLGRRDLPLGDHARELDDLEIASNRVPAAQRVVLDTSVLVADPACLGNLGAVDVVIPLTVIEELDGLKTRPDDVGRSARAALRTIEEMRLRHGGSLAAAVPLGEGSLQIEVNGIQRHLLVEHGLDPEKPDNRIIGAALGQRNIGPTVMVSNDAALRIKAAHLGVDAREHRPSRAAREVQAMGWRVIDVDHTTVDNLYSDGLVDVAEIPALADGLIDPTPTGQPGQPRLREN